MAKADLNRFAIAISYPNGDISVVGDRDEHFTIQSLCKPFVLALARDTLGREWLRTKIGGNNTGLPYNSVLAVELNQGHPRNPMVNAGALLAVSNIPGSTAEEKWLVMHNYLSSLAGRWLEIDRYVYESESSHNFRNQALANLLAAYGRIDIDPTELTDLYTRLCSLSVRVEDLALMGGTLMNSGVQPRTKEKLVSDRASSDTLAILASAGMYEDSGNWLIEVGVPAKSGISGGILAIVPGKMSIVAYSPRLDDVGNSVRGRKAISYIAQKAKLSMFNFQK